MEQPCGCDRCHLLKYIRRAVGCRLYWYVGDRLCMLIGGLCYTGHCTMEINRKVSLSEAMLIAQMDDWHFTTWSLVVSICIMVNLFQWVYEWNEFEIPNLEFAITHMGMGRCLRTLAGIHNNGPRKPQFLSIWENRFSARLCDGVQYEPFRRWLLQGTKESIFQSTGNIVFHCR